MIPIITGNQVNKSALPDRLIFLYLSMVVFRQKKIITTKSLGEELRRARQTLHLSLLSIERKLGISQNYLEALENNEWELLPGEIYLRIFLKKYSEFLGMAWDKVVEKYEQEKKWMKNKQIDGKERFGILKQRLVEWPKLIRNSLVWLAAIMIVGYLGWQTIRLISPPDLKILYPAEGFISRSSKVIILGQVENGSRLVLNGEEIAVANDGYFTIDINLNKGLNIIKIEAKKRYGRERVDYRRIILEK